jgi:hypothetical protein
MAAIRRIRTLVTLLAVAGLAIAAPASAGPYDVIMIDRPVFQLCAGCGLYLSGADFALIVNTGTQDIPDEDLLNATFFVRSSAEEIEMACFANPFRPLVGPVRHNEVVGLVQPINQVMLQYVAPGETFRNRGPIFGMQVYCHRDYIGPVSFEIHMRIGDHQYVNVISAEVRSGFFADMEILSAGRGSANPITTPTTSTTWGAIKATYR